MTITLLKSKIHRATVTEANIDYVGSITIDKNLMDAAGLLEYEMVHVVDINNGSRLQTYVIAGRSGSGCICLNGAAARLMHEGDKVIIMAYCQLNEAELTGHRIKVVFVDDENGIKQISSSEIHGNIM